MKKFKFIEINYYCHEDLKDPAAVIKKHEPSNLFAGPFSAYADIVLVKHMNFNGEMEAGGIHYYFSKRSNHFFQLPARTHSFVARQNPGLVLVQGFIFPWQVILLRRKLGKQPIILLQHQGESPAGKKIFFQRLADKSVDGYLFSARGNAAPWLKAGIIRDASKCFELPSSSSTFKKQDKQKSRLQTGMKEGLNFLWIGRLDGNKDPLTVLKAFEQYVAGGGPGYLSMIYSDDLLLEDVKRMVGTSTALKQRVRLVGKIPHEEVETWLSAADFYISASWNEGGSYALTEAMACGCIPVVTAIPPAMKTIDNGRYGFYFEPGNANQLSGILKELTSLDQENFSNKLAAYFNKELSGKAVADNLVSIYKNLARPEGS